MSDEPTVVEESSPEVLKESEKDPEKPKTSGILKLAENLFEPLVEVNREEGASTNDSIVAEEIPEDDLIDQILAASDTEPASESVTPEKQKTKDNLIRGSNCEHMKL